MIKSVRKIVNYIKSIINADTKESSKRFIALSTMLLVSYVVVRFTNVHNIEFILGELLFFVCVLMGIASYENVNKNKPFKNLDK
jgi:hypothetical protein